MEGHHSYAVGRRWPEARERALLLGDFLPEPPHRIDDPWGHEDQVFQQTFERIDRAVGRLAEALESQAG
jgi:protein-tyrosine-phosphatase